MESVLKYTFYQMCLSCAACIWFSICVEHSHSNEESFYHLWITLILGGAIVLVTCGISSFAAYTGLSIFEGESPATSS